MNNTELFKDENSSKLVQKLDNLTINLGEDNQDVLNIDSSVYVNNIERHIPDEFKTTDKNKYLIVDTNNNYKYVDLNLDNSKFRFHKICSEKPDLEDTSNIISPVDGDIHLKMNETMLILLNFSGWRESSGSQTWTFKYRIKNTSIYTAFDYPELGQFKHYYNASADHQHRSGQIVFNSSSKDIIIDSFQVDFTDRMDPNDFLSMNALIIPNNYLKSFTFLQNQNNTESIDGSQTSSSYQTKSNLIDKYIGNENDFVQLETTNGDSNYRSWQVFIDFEKSMKLKKYRIWGRREGALSNEQPKDWVLYGSNTGDKIPILGAGVTHTVAGVTVSHSSAYNSSSGSERLFDNQIGSYTDGWHAGYNAAKPHYIKINFSSSKTISRFYMWSRTNEARQFPNDFILYGSNSAPSGFSTSGMTSIYVKTKNSLDSAYGNFYYAKTYSGSNASDNIEQAFKYIIPPSSRAAYRYYILKINDSADTNRNSGYVTIGELSMYEDTWTALDTQTNATFNSYSNTNFNTSDNISLANEYTVNAAQDYQYYILNITSTNGNTISCSISELDLEYKSNLSIPEQSNNAGSELITNGGTEIWNKPTTNNLIGIDNDSAYNAVTVNKDNTALTCMSNNEVIQLPTGTTLQRPNITKNGQIRYNTTTSCYEIYKDNSWKKIITSDISINNQINTELSDSSYYNQMPAPYSASICLLHRDFVGDGRYDDHSPYTSYGAYVNVQQKEYAPDYSEYFSSDVWYENSFDIIIYDTSPEQNMAYVRKFQPGENPRDTATDSDTWNGGGIVIRKSGTYVMYYSSSIRHTNGTFHTAFYKNNTNISQQTGTTTKTINGIDHNFIDKNYTAYLKEGDLIRIRTYHTRYSHTTWSWDKMINYDYNDPTNAYNYDYMLKIASKLTVRLLDSTSLDSDGGGGY